MKVPPTNAYYGEQSKSTKEESEQGELINVVIQGVERLNALSMVAWFWFFRFNNKIYESDS